MIKFKKLLATISAFVTLGSCLALTACSTEEKSVVLRVCNWEEYIDLGDWGEDEVIDLESKNIFGENSLVDDFTEWFNSSHNYNIRVEYSTFGTNEDLYNRLSLGDVYDLVCPSDYMLMKLIAEGNYVEYSDGFWDVRKEDNYYAQKVSRYIDGADGEGIFNMPEYDWHGKAACYMWGTTGLVYNPEKISSTEDVSTWSIFLNEYYKRQVTIKDNVRDSYFPALGIINKERLFSGNISAQERSDILNSVDSSSIAAAEDILKLIKNNVYSFETDAGKADMVTGKVIANYQWSGDAVYIMDEAESDSNNPTELWYSVPDECTNLWFDGWLMLKTGIDGNAQRQEAAEAFVNFISRPDNAIRNMYYIGYSSSIADELVFEYINWNYEAETDDTFDYDLSYFFGDSSYTISVDASEFEFDDEDKKIINRGRQLFAQYPPQNVIDRSTIMLDFGDKLGEINQMWINVRCLDLKDIPVATVAITAAVIGVVVIAVLLYVFRYRLFIKNKPKDGYEKIEN